MSDIWLGLDFGTSNSSLSLNKSGKIHLVNVDKYSKSINTMRSVLYFDDQNVYVGEEAIIRYIKNGAIGRYMQSLKSFLPSTVFDYTSINGKICRLDDLISIILRKLKFEGEKEANCEIENVVLGRPVSFSKDSERDKVAQNRLLSAAQKAGFTNIHFELEPIAAALAYETTLKIGEEKIAIIGDFGGGTSDLAVVRLIGGAWKKQNNRSNDVLSVGGVRIGGDTFDSRIMNRKIAKYFGRDAKVKHIFSNEFSHVPYWIMESLCQWHIIPLLKERKSREAIRNIKRHLWADDRHLIDNLEKLIDNNYGFELFRAIEKAKINLSTHKQSIIKFCQDSIRINENLYRKKFEELIAGDIEDIQNYIDSVVNGSRLKYDDIEVVILTGGSSRIPIINQLFKNKFGEEKIRQTGTFTSVAYGMGISTMKYLQELE